MEEWRPVKGFKKSHEVSSIGRVRTIDRYVHWPRGGEVLLKGKMLRLGVSKQGYIVVSINYKNVEKTKKVHRLVAEAFIRNPMKKPCVNHKDGDKQNNHVNNLEWCTHKENSEHAIRTGLQVVTDKMRASSSRIQKTLWKPVDLFTKEGVFVKRFKSILLCGKYINGSAYGAAAGRNKTCKGYIVRLVDKSNHEPH